MVEESTAVKVTGIDTILRNLNKEIKKIEGRTLGGLILAAQDPVRREAQQECPVVTGNLKASAYVVASNGKVPAGKTPEFEGKDAAEAAIQHSKEMGKQLGIVKRRKEPTVGIGFSALYAARVHENPRAGKTGGISPSGQKYTAGRTGSGRKSMRAIFSEVGKWKFLEDPLKRNVKRILQIIARKAKIK